MFAKPYFDHYISGKNDAAKLAASFFATVDPVSYLRSPSTIDEFSKGYY